MICDLATPALRAIETDLRKPSVTSFKTSRANSPFCIVRGSPRMCIRTSGTRCRAASSARCGSDFSPEMSLMISAPASSAASATSSFCVSIEIGILSRPRRPCKTGSTCASSSSAGVPQLPGRVDSPPISSKSAPAAPMTSACSMARLVSRNFPPLEKLSGVTFKTPITRVRSPRTSVREGRFRRKICRRFMREAV